MESLRIEEEEAVAVAKANVIDDELGFTTNDEPYGPPDLPVESASHRVQRYLG